MSVRSPRSAEHARLAEATGRAEDDLFNANPWYEWGPYLSERAWGTVREDYSASGDAWESFPHDHARSRAYRWNEDGMAGISDIRHELCLGLALWNGADSILKERMFGLTGPQGNHGEDVKEYWWYLEGLPSHALLKWRYHYPQAAFPYEQLVDHGRGLDAPELELLDTGVFDGDRYWSVDVTYAKASPTDVLMRIELENHGPDEATLEVLPTLWFRNTWSYGTSGVRPRIEGDGTALTVAEHRLAGYRLAAAPGPGGVAPEALFCENESNFPRLFGVEATTPYPKDGINDHVVSGASTVNPEGFGTKAALRYRVTVPAGGKVELRLRLHDPARSDPAADGVGADFGDVIADREQDADEFFVALAPTALPVGQMAVLRQSCAGLVWSKQIYPYNVARWLDGDPLAPAPPEARRHGRNSHWRHLDSFDVLAMPDPWEYPWFAAWDLGFHCVPWAHFDPAFAKYQLIVLVREWFQSPNGAIPAYEWNFDDVNPPVHVMAALRVFAIEGGTDHEFLERIFQKLLINFTWWLNREDADGNNVFSGGFLGLDNISPIDRSNLPEGVRLEQADGTAWMAYYALSMLLIALVLVEENDVYWDMVIKFLEQFVLVARALERQGLYDADDAFFYDRLVYPSGESTTVRVKTIAGLLPLLPAVPLPARVVHAALALGKRFSRLREAWAETGGTLGVARTHGTGEEQTWLLSVIDPGDLRKTLAEFFDEAAFLSPHGLRSVSKRYEGNPYTLADIPGASIDYEPAESTTSMFGGNSNWRGPIWMPLNYLAIRQFVIYEAFFGDDFKIEYPTGSGQERTFGQIAQDISDRLIAIWLPDGDGRRPLYGGTERLQTDPAWKDNLVFNEYFHGDNGAGLGATHQTGWTALVADLILDPPSTSTTSGIRRS
jgi:hypothetical protein